MSKLSDKEIDKFFEESMNNESFYKIMEMYSKRVKYNPVKKNSLPKSGIPRSGLDQALKDLVEFKAIEFVKGEDGHERITFDEMKFGSLIALYKDWLAEDPEYQEAENQKKILQINKLISELSVGIRVQASGKPTDDGVPVLVSWDLPEGAKILPQRTKEEVVQEDQIYAGSTSVAEMPQVR